MFHVQLVKPLDSKNLKEGDEVEAQRPANLPHAVTTIPPGSKIIGHVTVAKARSKGDQQSSLGIVFDKIRLPDGKEVAIEGVIRAVGPSPAGDPNLDLSPAVSMRSELPGLAPNSQSGSRALLTDETTGVLEVRGLRLAPNGVLTSTGKEVKLDSGMQITLQIRERSD